MFNSSYKDKPTFLFVSLTLSTVDKPGTQRNLPSSWASENPIIKAEYFPGPVKESLLVLSDSSEFIGLGTSQERCSANKVLPLV